MPPLTDPSAIRALLDTDRPWAVYPLGDLAPAHFRHSTWLHAPGPAPALALLYRAFAPPVLFALGPPAALEPLLPEIAQEPELYLHDRPDFVPLLASRSAVGVPKRMWRMILDRARWRPPPEEGLAPLGVTDLGREVRLEVCGPRLPRRPVRYGRAPMRGTTPAAGQPPG